MSEIGKIRVELVGGGRYDGLPMQVPIDAFDIWLANDDRTKHRSGGPVPGYELKHQSRYTATAQRCSNRECKAGYGTLLFVYDRTQTRDTSFA